MGRITQKLSLVVRKHLLVFLLFILLFLSIITSILLPQAARPLAWTALCLGLGLAIFATVRRDIQTPLTKL